MKRIDFETEKVYHDNGITKWYIDKHFNEYLLSQQADNLPIIKGFGCFIVKGDDIEDYVLVDANQNVLASFEYTLEGYGQMEARINIMKIDKHYDSYEESNI